MAESSYLFTGGNCVDATVATVATAAQQRPESARGGRGREYRAGVSRAQRWFWGHLTRVHFASPPEGCVARESTSQWRPPLSSRSLFFRSAAPVVPGKMVTNSTMTAALRCVAAARRR